jgi:hypothetical protein
LQHKSILQRDLPEGLKLTIAKNIENHLFSQVSLKLIFYSLAGTQVSSKVSITVLSHLSNSSKSSQVDEI